MWKRSPKRRKTVDNQASTYKQREKSITFIKEHNSGVAKSHNNKPNGYCRNKRRVQLNKLNNVQKISSNVKLKTLETWL